MGKLLSSLILLVGSTSFAGVINSGSFNPVTQKVELSVSYGGGCSVHSFKLSHFTGCAESFPVQCSLQLEHTTDKPDFCEAYITQELELDLPEGMLTDNYYQEAYITINGAGQSSVSFQLPR